MDGPLAQVATCSHGSARTDDHAISLHFVKPAPGGDLRSFRPKKLAAVWCMLSLIPVIFGRLHYSFMGTVKTNGFQAQRKVNKFGGASNNVSVISVYCISANSFRRNYSFLKVKNVEIFI